MVQRQTRNCCKNEQATILWNMPIHIDREIVANKPDIIIRDQRTKKCQMIKMVVKSDSDTSVKVVEKLSKYKDLELEIPRTWKRKTEKIRVLLGRLRSLRRDWKSALTEFQERLAAHILRGLSSKPGVTIIL